MKKAGMAFLVLVIVLIGAYLLGPKPKSPDLAVKGKELPSQPAQLDQYIQQKESAFPEIKPDNEARIVWADSAHQKTPWAIVYLHGFSASQGEGFPTHEMLASRYHSNLFLSRLDAHGLDTQEPLLDMSAEGLLTSAIEAIEIGRKIGDKVLVIGTSTGGTLALFLASTHPELVDALVLYSPNIQIYDGSSVLLDKPWGLQIARMAKQSDYNSWDAPDSVKKYWTSRYRLEAVVSLQNLVSHTMKPDVFKHVTQPAFVGYYFKDEEHQDHTVSVPAILRMYDALGTPAAMKEKKAFPEAGDHVIGSRYTSGDWKGVYTATCGFLESKLGWKPVQ